MTMFYSGKQGTDVWILQLWLNMAILPSPRLRLDGVLGKTTEDAIRIFQEQCGMEPTGAMDEPTWAALGEALSRPPPPHVAKFLEELGTLNDFVRHVKELEAQTSSTSELVEKLLEFDQRRVGDDI